MYQETGYALCLSLCDSMQACKSFALDYTDHNIDQCILYDYAIEDGVRDLPQSPIVFYNRGGTCPENSSGLRDNLVENGDFETGDPDPWFTNFKTPEVYVSVVRSDSAPGEESHPTGLQYALKFDIVGNQ